ncbi:MAG: GTPase Era [Syntrophaceae bacterium]
MFKSGFIGIIGKPNVGKSTLLNRLIGQKIAITTHKPQTTRNRITGIKNLEDAQIIFIDTPGLHEAKSALAKSMVNAAREVLAEVDIALLVVDADSGIRKDDLGIIDSLKAVEIPVIAVLNKIDTVRKEELLPVIDSLSGVFPFKEIVPVSAIKDYNLDRLEQVLVKYLPEGPKLFPDDMITDVSERFIAAEIIREKVTLLTHEEIPYSTAVIVDSFKEDEEKNLIRIQAVIQVEKDSQKGIIIGSKGSMLKEIGRQARLDMEKFFAARVYLELFVRARKDWTRSESMLQQLGYSARKRKPE